MAETANPVPAPDRSQEPASAAGPAAGTSQSTTRESRRLLSTCMAIPDDIRAKYLMRTDCVVTHVTHRSNTLPHIQVRLPQGQKFEGKQPGMKAHVAVVEIMHVIEHECNLQVSCNEAQDELCSQLQSRDPASSAGDISNQHSPDSAAIQKPSSGLVHLLVLGRASPQGQQKEELTGAGNGKKRL